MGPGRLGVCLALLFAGFAVAAEPAPTALPEVKVEVFSDFQCPIALSLPGQSGSCKRKVLKESGPRWNSRTFR